MKLIFNNAKKGHYCPSFLDLDIDIQSQRPTNLSAN